MDCKTPLWSQPSFFTFFSSLCEDILRLILQTSIRDRKAWTYLYSCLGGPVAKYYKLGGVRRQKWVLSQSWRSQVGMELSGRLVPSRGFEGEFLSLPVSRLWQSLLLLACSVLPVLRVHRVFGLWASASVYKLPSFYNITPIASRTHPDPAWPQLNLITMTLFPYEVMFTGAG